MRTLKQFLNSLASQLLADVRGEGFSCLVFASAHSPLLSRRRAEIIVSRVRLVSMMFAILTPLWIVVDFLMFAHPMASMLAASRLATSFAFVLLASTHKSSPHMKDAYRMLVFLFLIPTAFFLYSHLLLSGFKSIGPASVIAAGYAFLPFILVAGLSIFPLTALEGLLFSLPVLLTSAIVTMLQFNQLNWGTHLGAFWLLLLIASTATLSGISQLAFMVALVRQANHDPLTCCFNRASGIEMLNQHFSISARTRSPLSVVFADLDKFKSINDKYGHETGDLALIATVDAMRNTLRSSDALVRWGGEEFLIVLPNTDCTSAHAMLERLRANGLGKRPDGSPMTASYGIAERLADSATNSERLIEIADQRMYQAKKLGGDCWVSCEVAAGASISAHKA